MQDNENIENIQPQPELDNLFAPDYLDVQGDLMSEYTQVPTLKLDDMVQEVRKSSKLSALDVMTSKSNVMDSFVNMGKSKKISSKTFDVDKSLTHTKLSDGRYVPKFKNYEHGTDNEDRLGKEQSSMQQLFNGSTKAFLKMNLNILDGTVGTVNGLVQGIKKGSLSAVFDNGFSDWVDDFNKSNDSLLPNYYTKEQRNMSWWRQTGTVNFIANDFLGGMSFVLGTIGSEAAWTLATGGASLPASVAKISLKAGAKALAKKTAKEALESSLKSVGKKYSKERVVQMNGLLRNSLKNSKTAEGLNNLRFLYTSAGYEAGVEARHHLNESLEDYLSSYRETKGTLPSAEEYREFLDAATANSNKVFLANVGLVGASNILQFGKYFGINTGISKSLKSLDFTRRITGQGIKTTAKGGAVALKPTARQAFQGKVLNATKDMFVEGFVEEGGQGVISGMSQNWLKAKYDPSALNENYSAMNAAYDAIMHTYGTNEGFKEVWLGMLIGKAGQARSRGADGKITPFGYGTFDKQQKVNEVKADAVNESLDNLTLARKSMLEKLEGSNQFQKYLTETESGMESGDFETMSRSWDAAQFSYLNARDNAGLLEDSLDNFEAVMGTEDSVGENVQKGLAVQMRENAELYSEAMEVSKALAPRTKSGKDFSEELAFNIFMGNKAIGRSKAISMEIADMVGDGGVVDALQFFQSLNKDKRKKIAQIKLTKSNIRNLEQENIKLQHQFESLKGRVGNESLGTEVDSNRQKYTENVQKLAELQNDLAKFSRQMISEARTNTYFGGTSKAFNSDSFTDFDIDSSLDSLEKLDEYLAILREDSPQAAQKLEYLMGQYRNSVKDFRGFNEVFDRMTSKEFKSDYKGIFGLKIPLLNFLENGKGTDYVGSELDADLKSQFDAFVAKSTKDGKLDEREKFTLETFFKLAMSNMASQRVKDPIFQSELTKIIAGEAPNQNIVDEIVRKIVAKVPLSPNEVEVFKLDEKGYKEKALDRIMEFGDIIEPIMVKKPRPSKTFENTYEGSILKMIEDTLGRHDYLDKFSTDSVQEAKKPTQKERDRYVKLKAKEKLTKKEDEEFGKLYEKINNFGRIMAAPKVGEYSLEDLLDLLASVRQFDNSAVAIMGRMENITEVLNTEGMEPVDNKGYYDNLQTYDKAFIRLFKNNLYISNVSLSGILDIIGKSTSLTITKGKGKKPLEMNNGFWNISTKVGEKYKVELEDGTSFIVEITKGGNLKLSLKAMENLHSKTPLKLYVNDAGVSKYQMLMEETSEGWIPVSTDFEHEGKVGMDRDVVYGVQKGDTLSVSVSLEDTHNKTLLDNYMNAKTPEAKEIAKNELRDDMVIYMEKLVGGKPVLVGVSKSLLGANIGNSSNESMMRLKKLREAALEEVLNNLDSDFVALGSIKAEVVGMYLGHPNFKIKEGMPVSEKLTPNDRKVVKDVGYVLNGDVKMKDGTKASTHPFLTKIIKSKKYKDRAIPVIVFEHFGRKVAYPVNLTTMEQSPMDKYGQIMDKLGSGASFLEVVSELNNLIRSVGLSIDEFGIRPGTSVEGLDTQLESLEKAMETSKFYPNIVDLLEKESMDSLLDMMTVNIDLSNNPIHSPKVKVDYNLNVEPKVKNIEKEIEVDYEEVFGKDTNSKSDKKPNPKKTRKTPKHKKVIIKESISKPVEIVKELIKVEPLHMEPLSLLPVEYLYDNDFESYILEGKKRTIESIGAVGETHLIKFKGIPNKVKYSKGVYTLNNKRVTLETSLKGKVDNLKNKKC